MAALYSTFISGLTLLQALAIQRDIVPHRRSARGIRACSNVLVTYATLFPEARESVCWLGSSRCEADLVTESFRIAFDDLIDSMEDEAAEQRSEERTVDGPSRSTHPAHQDVAGASSQQATDHAAISHPAPGVPNVGASTTWQQKVLDVEAKLQGDLQQDLARSVLQTTQF